MSANNINDLLQNDDAVDSLSDAEIRDVYARSLFAKVLFRNGDFHDDERHNTAVLAEGSDADLCALAQKHLRFSDVSDNLRPDAEESYNAEQLFAYWTVDAETVDADAMLTEIAREKLKTTLRGSGMPRMKVARRRVAHHADD
jgi:hypothetical protein